MVKVLKNAGINVVGMTATLDSLEDMKPSEAQYRVSASTDYAVYVEFGTKHMPAQPYLRPAVNETMRQADRLAGEADSTDEFVELIAESIAEKARGQAPVDTGRLKNSITVEEL